MLDICRREQPYTHNEGAGTLVLTLGSGEIVSLYQVCLKRAVDIVAAALGLVIVFPVLLFLAVLICSESPGGFLYRQRRIGKGGRIFTIYKLRSMHVGAEKLGYRTGRNDQRLTRVGRFIMPAKLDELPQLYNVLIGDMSLIGPRPLSVVEVLELQKLFPASRVGLVPSVAPGITGLEQISRKCCAELSYSRRFDLNWQYERGITLWADLRILALTLLSCRTAAGAIASAACCEMLLVEAAVADSFLSLLIFFCFCIAC